MLHGLAAPQDYDRELRIHAAVNSWMAEGQWHTLRPSEMGFVENERTSWSQAQAGSIGSWSTERYLPMAMAENIRLGLTWFWQIEHNGSWYWEISNVSARDNNADDVYAYLGGPDDLALRGVEEFETRRNLRDCSCGSRMCARRVRRRGRGIDTLPSHRMHEAAARLIRDAR